MSNHNTVMEFLDLGFSGVLELQLVHTALFLLVYLAVLAGNLLIVTVTALDLRLHNLMYLFLRDLSALDLIIISATIPKSIINLLADTKSISLLGCLFQVFPLLFSLPAELFPLTEMSFDRYVAICHSLRYDIIMDRWACGKMAAASWLFGRLTAVIHIASTFSLSFCESNQIHLFFCDIPQLLLIYCSQGTLRKVAPIIKGILRDFWCFLGINVSYSCIFSAVLKMLTVEELLGLDPTHMALASMGRKLQSLTRSTDLFWPARADLNVIHAVM
ncbi:olfactory receptor 14A16-like [Tachyglossus aculeatus]|uniref:olfactory receptor 14A16-like n=1 Tax=Tachyglossus aculeatus TaxID=9261 RepID=UPI0018F32584|nr:olfactory receptor 14A16-like [Tachyglossus aculeatus]